MATAGPKSSQAGLSEYYRQWEQRAKEMHDSSAATDWSTFDFSKLSAKDIGVRLGPMLSEAEFRELQKKRSQ